jgi:hypothetical protein
VDDELGQAVSPDEPVSCGISQWAFPDARELNPANRAIQEESDPAERAPALVALAQKPPSLGAPRPLPPTALRLIHIDRESALEYKAVEGLVA